MKGKKKTTQRQLSPSVFDPEDFREIACLSEDKLFFLIQYMSRRCTTYQSLGEWIFIKGSIPVTLVAHLDTAGTIPKREDIQYKQGWISLKRSKAKPVKVEQSSYKTIYHYPSYVSGSSAYKYPSWTWHPRDRRVLGADDRAGVYIMMFHFLLSHPDSRPNLLFTCQEETGLYGAKALAKAVTAGTKHKALVDALKASYCLIQLDRRHDLDAVFYNGEPQEFRTYICQFGFREAIGSCSDISVLCDPLHLCGVNLSVGYEKEHTSTERLRWKTIKKTTNKLRTILQHLVKHKQRWILPPKPVKVDSRLFWGDYEVEGNKSWQAPDRLTERDIMQQELWESSEDIPCYLTGDGEEISQREYLRRNANSLFNCVICSDPYDIEHMELEDHPDNFICETCYDVYVLNPDPDDQGGDSRTKS